MPTSARPHPSAIQHKPIWTLGELAAMCGVSERTIRRRLDVAAGTVMVPGGAIVPVYRDGRRWIVQADEVRRILANWKG